MNFTDLVVKFNSGDTLTSAELIQLHTDAKEISKALLGKGTMCYTLQQEAIRIQTRIDDIYQARHGRSIHHIQQIGAALKREHDARRTM